FHEVVDAYLNLCNQYMYYQVRFQKSKKYPFYENPEATLKKMNELYKDKKEMKRYMAGLSLSLILWKNHYLISDFFRDCLIKHKNKIDSYLEVGVGHGFYFSEAFSCLNPESLKTAIDLSPVSLELTQKTVNFFHPGMQFEAIEMDFLQFSGQKAAWNFITMGEVLEHVQTPGLFFRKAHDLLSPEGRLFFTSCVNCPILDHLYHFQSIEEIRSLLNEAGFSIESEQVIPAENLPMEEIVSNRVTINYAALIKKKE
ncbi:MAG: class I SAM-dependent methyltransferase, partial [Bacteroidales bacterium]